MPSLLQDTTKADEVCIVQHRKRRWRILRGTTKTQSFGQSLELTRTSNQNNRETLQTFKKTNLKRTDIALSLLFLFLIRKIKHRLSLPLRQCCSFVSEGPGDYSTWKCKSCDFPACDICGVLPITPKNLLIDAKAACSRHVRVENQGREAQSTEARTRARKPGHAQTADFIECGIDNQLFYMVGSVLGYQHNILRLRIAELSYCWQWNCQGLRNYG